MDHKIMYTLGQIARAVWPDGDTDQTIIDQLLVAPATGLALLTKSGAAKNADPDHLQELIGRLPADLADPKGGVKVDAQGPFWVGYYHYVRALDAAKNYGADELAAAGSALYGDRWQTDLARDLGLSDGRRIRQWLAGERPIPPGVWSDIAGLLRHRQMSIQSVLNDLT